MTYLAATLYVNRLYQEQPNKIALGGFNVDDIITGVKDQFNKLFDSKHSFFANFFSFIGPGVILKLGFPWITVAYEVAEALGFDWAGIWDSLKNSVTEILSGLFGGKKPTQEELHKQLDQKTEEALRTNVKETVDEKKLEEAQKKAQEDTPMPPRTGTISTHRLIKRAGIASSAFRSRGLLSRLFRKIIPWAITTLAVSLGLAAATGAVAGVAGTNTSNPDAKKEEVPGSSSSGIASTTREPIYNEIMSPSVDRGLYEFNDNGPNSVWIDSGNILNVRPMILGWIFSAFPQFKKDEATISNSKKFIEIENSFRNRNKLAQQLQIYSVPKPWERKIDIVSYIVNGYLKEKKT